jgi:hypothetical protein
VHSEATAGGDRARVRVPAIADTDSYLKSIAATLDALPDSWSPTQLIIKNPGMPSAAQIRAVPTARSTPLRLRR